MRGRNIMKGKTFYEDPNLLYEMKMASLFKGKNSVIIPNDGNSL